MVDCLVSWALHGGALLWNRLSWEMIQEVWEEDKAVEDWENVKVLIRKMGDLIIGGGLVSWMWLGRF